MAATKKGRRAVTPAQASVIGPMLDGARLYRHGDKKWELLWANAVSRVHPRTARSLLPFLVPHDYDPNCFTVRVKSEAPDA